MENKNLNLQFPLYFPDCKIININEVPQAHGKYFVWSIYLKSTINTPAHYPQHPLLTGKADFYFGIEASFDWKNKFSQAYQKVFNLNLKESIKKIKGKKVSVLAHLVQEERLTLNTLGIGIQNGEILLYNTHLLDSDMQELSLASQLQSKMPEKKDKIKRKKI